MALFEGGYFTIARVRRAPVRIHWSAPLGALLMTGFAFVPGFWVGFFVVIILHELGHALLVRKLRFQVASVDVHALGGVCRWYGQASEKEHAIIAWGGVLAQSALLVVAIAVRMFVPVTSAFLAELLDACIRWNAIIAGLNLIPIPPFDGANAWKILRYLRRPRRGPPSGGPTERTDIRTEIDKALRAAREEARKSRDKTVH